MKNLNTLLPCPFCGNQFPELVESHKNHWRVGCARCGSYNNNALGQEAAIQTWNTRLERKLIIELLQDVMQWHSDIESSEYNECDKIPCHWCELAQSIINSHPTFFADYTNPIFDGPQPRDEYEKKLRQKQPPLSGLNTENAGE